MENIKGIAFSICATLMLFGLFRSIFPMKRYEKYIRIVFSMIFVLLIINAIHSLGKADIKQMEKIDSDFSGEHTSVQLVSYIQNEINKMLSSKNYKSYCTKVAVHFDGEKYLIKEIDIVYYDEERGVVDYLEQITGVEGKQIRLHHK